MSASALRGPWAKGLQQQDGTWPNGENAQHCSSCRNLHRLESPSHGNWRLNRLNLIYFVLLRLMLVNPQTFDPFLPSNVSF